MIIAEKADGNLGYFRASWQILNDQVKEISYIALQLNLKLEDVVSVENWLKEYWAVLLPSTPKNVMTFERIY